jgi:hypothetical protein
MIWKSRLEFHDFSPVLIINYHSHTLLKVKYARNLFKNEHGTAANTHWSKQIVTTPFLC